MADPVPHICTFFQYGIFIRNLHSKLTSKFTPYKCSHAANKSKSRVIGLCCRNMLLKHAIGRGERRASLSAA